MLFSRIICRAPINHANLKINENSKLPALALFTWASDEFFVTIMYWLYFFYLTYSIPYYPLAFVTVEIIMGCILSGNFQEFIAVATMHIFLWMHYDCINFDAL